MRTGRPAEILIGKHAGEEHKGTLRVNYFIVSIRMEPQDAEIAGG